MKLLILIGGPMGVGKTAVSRELQRRLSRCAFLDGDWCWDMRPFVVNDDTKTMVMDNIRCVLNGFLRCAEIENIVFCWVMHEQAIIEGILTGLERNDAEVYVFSLIADEAALTSRIRGDIARGVRQPDVLARSIAYLPKYGNLDTVKIDTSQRSIAETAEAILRHL